MPGEQYRTPHESTKGCSASSTEAANRRNADGIILLFSYRTPGTAVVVVAVVVVVVGRAERSVSLLHSVEL